MIFLAIVSLILLILSIPINYAMSGQKNDSSYGEVKVSWLWGGIEFLCVYDGQTGFRRKFRLLGIGIGSHKSTVKAAVNKEAKEHENSFPVKAFLNKALIRKSLGLVKEVINHSKPHTFEINGKMGFDNPYNTAMAIGLISMLNLPGTNIQPIFDEEIIEGNLKLQGNLIILMVLWLVIKFLTAKPVRNIVIKLIKNKGEKIYG